MTSRTPAHWLARTVLAVAVATTPVAASLPARAADLRIGYVDSARVFQEYSVAKEAQERFDRQVQGWRDEAAEKQKAVDQLRVEVRDQSPILSAVKRQEKEEQLQKAISEYEAFIQDIWGPTGRAAQENQQQTNEIVGQIRSVVEKLAGDRGLQLVLDSSGGFIIFADRTLDLTPDVVKELNARTGPTGGAR
jgi:outer membrane protein